MDQPNPAPQEGGEPEEENKEEVVKDTLPLIRLFLENTLKGHDSPTCKKYGITEV